MENEKDNKIILDEDGYPLSTMIYLDDMAYKIPDGYSWEKQEFYEIEYELSKSREITVLLPVVQTVCTWEIDADQEEIQLVESDTFYPKSDLPRDYEGITPEVQKYTIKILEESNILAIHFKWINKNDADKAFEDMSEYYLLTLKLK